MLKYLSLIVMTYLLSACNTNSDQTPKLGTQHESVQMVLYFSDGDFDWKGMGEWILIESGETLQVVRNKIRPNQELITDNWNEVFLPAIKGQRSRESKSIQLDRVNGIACVSERCAYLYAICPSQDQLTRGKKCMTYQVK